MASRRIWLAAATVVLGVAAHVVGGGGADVNCAPLVAAALFAVTTTFVADRLVDYRRGCGIGAVTLVGTGQLVMHVELSGALAGHASPTGIGLGLTCGLVVTHAVATGAIVVMLLGVQRTLELPLRLASQSRAWLWALILPPTKPLDETPPWASCIVDDEVPAAIRHAWHGLTDRRRGPPMEFTVVA